MDRIPDKGKSARQVIGSFLGRQDSGGTAT